MQVINKKIAIFICLSIFIFGLFKMFDKEKTILDEVKLDIRDTNNSFAIYIEQNNGNYEESESKEFPKGYKYNYKKSNCTGIDGNLVSGVLDYNNETGIATVDTSDSLNCYLYFDKGAGLEIIGKEPNGLNLTTTSDSDEWTGMYRFQGKQSEGIENYICFGTSDQEECTSNPSKYMYRIIGIEESGRIKVIKKEALEDGDQWWTDKNTNIKWLNSKIYLNINGEKFLKNTELVPKGWEEKIDNNNWLFGSMIGNNADVGARQSGVEVYKMESGQKKVQWREKAEDANEEYNGAKAQTYSTSDGKEYYYIIHSEKWNETLLPHEVTAKIGLMNISDYYLSISNTANCQQDNQTYVDICNIGWIHLSQNDTKSSLGREWTMVSYGYDPFGGYLGSHVIYSDGRTNYIIINGLAYVRPVFYLKSNNMLKEGSGTEEDPFVIEDVTYEGEPKGLIEFAPKGLNTTTTSNNEEWTGMYRYQGQQSDGIENYICFGTSDKEECLKNQDQYMYRIIGIEEDGKLKLIKNTPIKEENAKTFQWNNTCDLEICDITGKNCTWSSSSLQQYLNTVFLNNNKYIPSTWNDKIIDYDWVYGDLNKNIGWTYESKKVYEAELSWHNEENNVVKNKIGLLYLSDFYSSYEQIEPIYSQFSNSWLHVSSNQDSEYQGEWLLNRTGNAGDGITGWVILANLTAGTRGIDNYFSVRPVFFLKNNIKIVDGNGKSDNPFIIN